MILQLLSRKRELNENCRLKWWYEAGTTLLINILLIRLTDLQTGRQVWTSHKRDAMKWSVFHEKCTLSAFTTQLAFERVTSLILGCGECITSTQPQVETVGKLLQRTACVTFTRKKVFKKEKGVECVFFTLHLVLSPFTCTWSHVSVETGNEARLGSTCRGSDYIRPDRCRHATLTLLQEAKDTQLFTYSLICHQN